MATLATDRPAATPQGETRFFFKMACAMALVLVTGFSINLAFARSSFAVPMAYHVHALVYFGWVALFVLQSGLVASGNVALHKRLGWIALLWLPIMLGMGLVITVTSLRRTGGPFFFDANEFLISNPLSLVAFGGLTIAAILLRRRTDWHRRLMVGAMASIMGPGFGRILPSPLLVPWSWEVTSSAGMIFILIGMWHDRRINGQIHPAWFIGLAAGLGWIMLGQVLAYTDWGTVLTRSVVEGYPGESRPMEAYVP